MINNQINLEYAENMFNENEAVNRYYKAVSEVGLWASEKKLIERYFNKNKSIIDIGCGVGRTTFNLHNLGYKNIEASDFSIKMIEKAEEINQENNYKIKFLVDNIISTKLQESSYDFALFSYNGIMQIPGRQNRNKAIKSIEKILKDNGIFIFTTPDRDEVPWKSYWIKEKERWNSNKQNTRLIDFGDVIFKEEQREFYLHFPIQNEVMSLFNNTGFSLIYSEMRDKIIQEEDIVKDFSANCRFWVMQKLIDTN